ncbi:outer membrane beta-barrel protein [Aquabacterium humicola]|uniref:outer membrane beta-barrel protein n=1 Tax=Aquabacterium humicola TaxID=3237377 RepID=UPI002543D956|nr:outer membrane beta-barrel protein [Rubrivivax pictus]
MNQILRPARVALLLAAASVAQAEGLYGGASLGQSDWKTEQLPNFGVDRRDTAGKVFGGWRFGPNFAAELGYARLGRARYTGGVIPGTVTLRGHGLYLDAVGTVPLGANFSVLARAGVFTGRARLDAPVAGSDADHGTRWKAGLGAEYAFNPQWAARIEWERYRFDVFGDKGDVDLLSAGVRVNF